MRLLRRGFAPRIGHRSGGVVGVAGRATGDTADHGGTSADPPASKHVQLRPIGTPTWRPVGFQLFSAPSGQRSGYVNRETTLALLPARIMFPPRPRGGSGGGDQPPYDDELAAGVDAQGYHERGRTLSELSNGNGVWLVWMNVPHPGTRTLPYSLSTRHPERAVPHPRVSVLHRRGERFPQ